MTEKDKAERMESYYLMKKVPDGLADILLKLDEWLTMNTRDFQDYQRAMLKSKISEICAEWVYQVNHKF